MAECTRASHLVPDLNTFTAAISTPRGVDVFFRTVLVYCRGAGDAYAAHLCLIYRQSSADATLVRSGGGLDRDLLLTRCSCLILLPSRPL